MTKQGGIRLQTPLTAAWKGKKVDFRLRRITVAGSPLEVAEKMFGRKLCLSPKQSVKRRQPLWVIRKEMV
jgi:hypothetical protein